MNSALFPVCPLPIRVLAHSMACALALLALPAHAQQSTAELPAVTVRADGAGEGTAPLRPSAQAERERLERVPGGTNLALPQQESRLATLRDALDYQPGIVIQDFFGATDQPRLSIRGSGIQSNPLNRGVLLLQDGMPLNEADGSFIIGLIEPRNAALISARRGANTLTPGATTLGGEVDFQSLTGADERGSVRAEAGSFGRKALQGAIGLQGAQWDGRISVSGDRFDGYRHHSASQREALHANLGFQGAGGFENRTYLSWTDLDFDIPTVVPKDRVRTNPRGVMGDGNTPQDQLLNVYRRDPRREATQLRLANRSRWGSDALRQELGVYWQDTDDLFNNQTSYAITHSRTTGAQWQASGQTGGPLAWRAALGWSRSSMDRDLDATNPANGTQMQRFGAYDLTADNLQAQAGADWRLAPAWTLVGQWGWSRQSRDATSRLDGRALDQQWTFSTPKIGVNWTPAPTVRWWANLSRSQEAPTFWEIVAANVAPNAPAAASSELVRLKLQRATTFEVGGQGRWGEGTRALHWQLAVYRSQVADELMSTTDESGIKVGTYNYAGGTRHQGVEAGLSGNWPLGAAGGLEWRGSWTYSDFRFKEGIYAGNRIAGVPRHLINAEVLWRVATASGTWRVGPSLRWMPTDTPTDHANTAGSEQDAYALLGFKLEWRSGPWTAYLLADNVTDRRYASSYAIRNQATAAQPGYLPGLGRNVAAGVTYRF
ncbi:TonB-dependent receptor family protein [Alicycliphilus denitrificans]|uniref:TonB-dependent receptor n=1 Tax=Alicycliphilus denitrificans TaxID=179636 RepID=A0A3R7F149_9BURK|nr:TonB-dependent receptor [Alicycliphilus denitrificans]RKJ98907.1 TonB-dependent receptor [Alicycliphilus denitrificans]